MTKAWSARQGDVLIVRVNDSVGSGKDVPRDGGRIVLAYGEATGHCHAILDRGASLSELSEDRTSDGDAVWNRAARILRVSAEAGVELRHEEHATIVIPPGTYRVIRQREWTGEDERQVAD